MARRSITRSNPLTLGFAGSGQLDRKAIDALLDDYVDGAKVELIIVPATLDDYTDEIVAVVAWAKKRDIDYAVLSSEDDVKGDRALKKLIADASEDYAITSAGLATDMAELLKGSEEEPVLDGRLMMFADTAVEEDITFVEAADALEIPAIDLCAGCETITLRDEDDPEPEPEPEPEEEAPSPARRRRGAAVVPDEDVDPEDSAEPTYPDPDDDVEAYSKAEELEFERMTSRESPLTELKKQLKAMDRTISTDKLKGVDKAYVADLIILVGRRGGVKELEEAADEAQAAPAARRGRGASQSTPEPAEVADEAQEVEQDSSDRETDSREAVFTRLRNGKEVADRIAFNLVASLRAVAAEGEEGQELERAAGAVAASLMLFAEHIITEARKPKSSGRPRKDGTAAQPKDLSEPEAPRRRVGRPRKDGS